MKKILPILIVIIVVSVLGFFAYQNNIFGATTKVVIGPKWINQAQFAGIYSAQERGIYRKHGVAVEVKEFDFETSQIDDLLDGKIDFAILSAEEFLVFVSKGAPIQALAAIYQVSPYSIVSLSYKNIETPADFKNKLLGNKGGKLEEELFYKLLLSSVGLSSNNIKMIDLGFEYSEYEDLMKGTVDTVGLYRTDQLYFFDKENLEYNIIYPEQFGINTYNDIIVTTNELIENDPELVKNFVSATVEGWDYAIDNPKDAVEDTLKYVTNENYKDYDYEEYILTESIPLIKPDLNTTVGSMTFDQWNKLYQNMLDRDLIEEGVSIQEVFTTEFLP